MDGSPAEVEWVGAVHGPGWFYLYNVSDDETLS